jgi:hypothetical protein
MALKRHNFFLFDCQSFSGSTIVVFSAVGLVFRTVALPTHKIIVCPVVIRGRYKSLNKIWWVVGGVKNDHVSQN